MKKIAIVTDSSSGFKNLEYRNLYVVPLTVTSTYDLNGKKITKSYYDGVDCFNSDVIKLLENKKIDLKTSQAPLGECIKLINKIKNEYDEIYVIPITSSTSGSISTWKMIASEYEKVFVINQHMGGPMLKWIILKFLKMSREGTLNKDYALRYAKKYKDIVFGSMIVNDINQLIKGGRVKTLVKKILNLLKVNVIISLDEKGMNFNGISKNYEKGVNSIMKYFKKHNKNFSSENIEEIMFIRNSNETLKQKIDECIKYVKSLFKKSNFIFSTCIMPSVLVAHAGNNSLIIATKLKD